MSVGNTFAAIYVVSCCLFGYSLMSSLVPSSLDIVSVVGIGAAFGVILGSWVAYILNMYFSFSFVFGIANIVVLSAISAILLLRRRHRRKFQNPPVVSTVFAVVLPSLFLLWFIFYGVYYQENWARGATFGDLPFHLNLISSFAFGCNTNRKSLFDLVTPFFAKERLAYPFLCNFHSAVLLSCFNASGHASITIPSAVFDFAIFAVLAGVVRTFSRREEPCSVAPWLFLFSGGLGFMNWVRHKELRGAFYTDFVHHWGKGKQGNWFQTIIHVLLPQRASLHSIPICWAVILILMHVGSSDKLKIREFISVGLLVAALPQVQPHSVIACAEWGVVFALVSAFPFGMRKMKVMAFNYGALAVVAIALGFFQMWPYMDRVDRSGFIKAANFCRMERGTVLWVWWQSMGITFVVGMIHGASILDVRQWQLFIPSVAVWAISNFVIYQPWHLDNTKVFNAGWIPLVVACGSNFLVRLFYRGHFGKICAILLTFFACFSGMLSAQMAATQVYPLWQKHDRAQELAEFARHNSSPKSIWVMDGWHAHPVSALAGRQSVSGYPGWTSSHGLRDSSRGKMITELLRNPDKTKDSDEFGVEFMCLKKCDKSDTRCLRLVKTPSATVWKLVFNGARYTVYERADKSFLARI